MQRFPACGSDGMSVRRRLASFLAGALPSSELVASGVRRREQKLAHSHGAASRKRLFR